MNIVWRLRNHSNRPPGCDCARCEAADELVRLRAEVSRMDCTCLPYAEPHDGMCSRCMALRGPS